ncbi:MAG: YceI family protein [Chthoniobacterales bacterium]
MKKLLLLLTVVSFTGGVLTARAEDTYKLDPVHSSISFKVRHFFSYVTGDFTKFSGTIQVDPGHPEKSTVTATIEASSINTRNEKRDGDLKSDDFFNVAKYPKITFKSKSVKQTGPDTGDIVGDLTMHGVTKEITLHGKFLGKGKGMGGAEISGWQITLAEPIKRSDYGLTWSRTVEGTAVVGQDVEVTIDVEADKAP